MTMKTTSNVSRRTFIGKSAAAAAGLIILPGMAGAKRYVAPSSRIQLGFIGLGKQAPHLLKSLMACPETVVVAACDVNSRALEKFHGDAQILNDEKYGSGPKVAVYNNFEELLARKDVDAVVIATPDHWHGVIAVAAAKAGKDIYCEKPMSATVEEGRAMVDSARKYDRVFQTGNMQRSWASFRKACELVRNGYIGDVKEVNVSVGIAYQQCVLPEEEIPDFIDWNRWIGPAPYRGYHYKLAPVKAEHNFWPLWRDYYPFGGGMVTDWGAHMFDIAQWGLGMDGKAPVEFIPPREAHPKMGMKMIYDNGLVMNHKQWMKSDGQTDDYSGEGNALQFVGSEGTLEVSRSFMRTNPGSIAALELKSSDTPLEKSDNHYQNWIDAVKSRKKPLCDVAIGHSTAALCNIVNIAYDLERPLKWDYKKERFLNDDGANKMLGRPMRGDWSIEI